MRLPPGPARLLDDAVGKGWIRQDRARLLRVAGAPVLVVVVLLLLALAVFRAGGAGQPSAYAEFVDRSGNGYLDVQLDEATTSYGAFSVVLPQQGRVWPKDKVDVSDTGGRVQLRYDGDGLRDPRVVPGVRDEPPSLQKPEAVRLKLAGQVDAEGHVASVDVWVDGEQHHLEASGEPQGARAAVEDFLAAVSTQDWDSVYSLETPYMRNGSKRRDLVDGLSHGGVITEVSAARATGPTTFEVRGGTNYGRTPVRFTYSTGSGTERTSVDAVVVTVVDGGSWGVLTVE